MIIKKRVIVVEPIQETIELGNRLIESGNNHSCPNIELFYGINPIQYSPKGLFIKERFDDRSFTLNQYSVPERAMSCFLSHYRLWKECAETDNCIMMIFEHDAIFTRNFDESILTKFKAILNIGAPSFGNFKTSNYQGIQPLFSKQYMPGAHAYIINTYGAKELISRIHGKPEPTDVYISNKRFPGLIEEYNPHFCIVDDSFTTVQLDNGCLAKHSYRKNPLSYRKL